jgi:hypothetical protein
MLESKDETANGSVMQHSGKVTYDISQFNYSPLKLIFRNNEFHKVHCYLVRRRVQILAPQFPIVPPMPRMFALPQQLLPSKLNNFLLLLLLQFSPSKLQQRKPKSKRQCLIVVHSLAVAHRWETTRFSSNMPTLHPVPEFLAFFPANLASGNKISEFRSISTFYNDE